MDIIDAIEKGITIIQYLREFIDNVKKAPETLRFLEIQAIGVKTLLDELYYAPPEALIPLAEDRSQLEELSTLVRHHLREIETFIGTVHKKDKAGTLRLRKSVWIRRRISGDDAEQLSSRLVSLRDALQTIAVSTVMRSNKRQEGNHAEILQILRAIGLHTSATRWQQTINPQPVTHVPSGPSSSLRLQCLDGCLCRCHSRATRQVMPEGLVPLFGRLHVSRRLLSALPFAAIPLECNVQSCRRSDSSPRTLTWTLPPWWPSFDLSIFLRRLTVHASIRTPNLVSLHAPLWDLIARSDIEGVRALLISGAASIDDINVWGITVLVYAVRSWFRSPCSQRYEMLRFLAESGADPDLSFAYYPSTKQYLAQSAFGTILEDPDTPFAYKAKTTTVAVDICQSLLHVDVIDIVEDYIETRPILGTDLEALWDTSSQRSVDGTIFRRLSNFSPLGWAIRYNPQLAIELLQRGCDVTVDAPLAEAACRNRPALIGPLLAAGADVNARDGMGWAAIHYACYWLFMGVCEALMEFSEHEIDWDAVTPDGKTPLQLTNESPRLSQRSPSELTQLLSVLLAHSPIVIVEKETPCPMPGGFN